MCWETPQYLFDQLNEEFHFTLDPCCVPETAKCPQYYTPSDNGLIQDWSNDIVFVNPPYGKEIKKWIKKSHDEAKNGATVVLLIPARTDTQYFHDYIYNQAEIRFIKGRIKFIQNGEIKNAAPFPSMIVVFRPNLIISKFSQ